MAQEIVPGGTVARAIAGTSPQEVPDQRQRYEDGMRAVKAAVLRQHAACNDLGELGRPVMVEARWEGTAGHTLPGSRPGSWEAYGLESLIGNVLNQLAAAPRDLMANSSWRAVLPGD